ncbi:FAD-dependent oxidoreductase [Pseudobacteriovorax antillogorgiicola]|uniref:D-amino-acid oxidase n=1 Tax=Pseudobacteriovorax antillogorgiicola TaxID=1513793 RepID=A0A1Y6BTY2_9BACT|nr:FAD-dependent oxidoreductase [Pseudobacteriovorax antillogorgiicola]TCS53938.1 glycine oxidase [Pseudobacteriovorax antillogorgiicola]SMF20296.1 glycine oxidase [Pseudobacteriovorax antillogorgiicola]
MKFAVVGGGVLGRTLAMELLPYGPVDIWDPHPKNGRESSAYQAGGMLAPYSEREKGEPQVFALGKASLELWPQLFDKLSKFGLHHQSQGSLIVAHRRDHGLWHEVRDKVCHSLPDQSFEEGPAHHYEAELSANLGKALFLPQEAHVDPRSFLEASYSFLLEHGVQWIQERVPQLAPGNVPVLFDQYDYTFDCRGLGALQDTEDLRGVRGEAAIVHAPQVNLHRPVRVMHPRYSLYVVPRPNNRYYLGATQIESSSNSPVTLRSGLEILSAAFAIHPGFAESHIEELCVGLRPAFFDNNPEIRVSGRFIQVNGLFRHGFLLSPIIAHLAAAHVLGNHDQQLFDTIVKDIS